MSEQCEENPVLARARTAIENGEAVNRVSALVARIEELEAAIERVRDVLDEWDDLVIDGEDPEEHIIRALDDNNNNKGVIMTDNDALYQTRDALHTAFTIIANARNCLDNGERDPVLAEQWHEAAARFIQDYNANLDLYTGYPLDGGCDACGGTGQWVDYPAVSCPKCHGCARCSRSGEIR